MNCLRLSLLAALVPMLFMSSAGFGQDNSGYPKTLQHPLGEIVIPEKPQRIISLEAAQITDSLIALGHPPIASATYGLAGAAEPEAWPPAIREKALELQIPSIGTSHDLSLETIVVLKPDLIIAFPGQVEVLYLRLSLMAPVLVIEPGRDFRPGLRKIAEALEVEQKAEVLIDELEAQQEKIRHDYEGTEVGIIRPRQFFTQLYGPGSNAGRLLTEAGLTVVQPFEGVSITPDSPGAINDVSLERIPEIEADFLFFILYNLDRPLADYLRHPIWQRNKSVVVGDTAGVQGNAWTNHGPLGALQMLNQVQRVLGTKSGATPQAGRRPVADYPASGS